MKDLTKIKKPFDLLGKKTRAALEAHGGPYQYLGRCGWSDCQSSPMAGKFDSLTAYRVKPAANHITSVTPVDTGSLYRHWLSIPNSVTVVRTADLPDMGGEIAGFTGGDRDEREVVLAYSTQAEIYAAVRAMHRCNVNGPCEGRHDAQKAFYALRVPS
jgi:hypothetical protein